MSEIFLPSKKITHPTFRIDTDLAEVIGLQEAVTLRMILYRINRSHKAKEKNGRKWFRASYNLLLEYLPFLSRTKLTAILSFLKREEWILAKKLGTRYRDQTRWYSVNQEKMLVFSQNKEGKSRPKTVVNTNLAIMFGLEKSIVLDYIRSLLEKKKRTARKTETGSVSKSYQEWQEIFPFLSTYKIGKIFRDIQKENIFYVKTMSDGRKSYSIPNFIASEK
jgi:hypothetical protein